MENAKVTTRIERKSKTPKRQNWRQRGWSKITKNEEQDEPEELKYGEKPDGEDHQENGELLNWSRRVYFFPVKYILKHLCFINIFETYFGELLNRSRRIHFFPENIF